MKVTQKTYNCVNYNTLITMPDNTTRFGVSVPKELLRKFDEKIEEKMYSNRSEAIRDLIRDFLVEEKWKESDEEVYGSLTLVFDHEKRGISDKLTELQHQDHTHIVSTMHIHLDKHNCMETMAIKGKPHHIKRIADKLISTKGVKHGKLMMTSV
ncbi:MAG: nickel-responsive transcriptional regulator NikR [Candidatus Saliniplasma sp.]